MLSYIEHIILIFRCCLSFFCSTLEERLFLIFSSDFGEMSLCVDMTGVGICQMSPPFSVFVISVQQEGFQPWTVYRRYCHFQTLTEHLQAVYEIPGLPVFTDANGQAVNVEGCLDVPYLEGARQILDRWLQNVMTNQVILRTQSMYHFLCADANMSPPYLEIHWRSTEELEQEGGAEMDMDDMFGGGGHDNRMSTEGEGDGGETVFRMSTAGGKKRMSIPAGKPVGAQGNPQSSMSPGDTRDNNDDINIESISLVESAEYLYDRVEEEGPPTGTTSPQRPNNKRPHEKSGAPGVLQLEVNNNTGSVMSASVSNASAMPAMDCPGDTSAATSSTSTIGSIASSMSAPPLKKKTISLDAFAIIRVVGKGSFGKVFLVRDKAKQTLHALKVLKKEYIIKKNQVEHTKTENSVLKYVHHPYIVGCTKAFQTADKLFFVLDYCAGGELFFHLGKVGRFEEPRAKFYAAQITLALAYVHSMDIVYRDLKPENVLLDEAGNIRLTDFGLSKEGVKDHSTGATSFCGTPEYIAPEVLLRQGHGRAVDWWSLGALLYEMLTGLPPFYSRNREVMFEKIMKAQLTFPAFISPVRLLYFLLYLLVGWFVLFNVFYILFYFVLFSEECQRSIDQTAYPRSKASYGFR